MWACSYSIGGTMPMVEWRRRWLYQVWTHRAISCRAWARVVQARRLMSSCCRVEKNDSAQALSSALPVLPVERLMPSRWQALANAVEVYCDPLSEWKMTSLRVNVG